MTASAIASTSTLCDVALVFKPRIALGGITMSPGAAPDAQRIAVLAVGVFLAAGAVGAFNQWAERDLDARMARTARRPFVTGQFEADAIWLAAIGGVLLVSVLAVAWATNWWATVHIFLGAFTYGVVYTLWLKCRTWAKAIMRAPEYQCCRWWPGKSAPLGSFWAGAHAGLVSAVDRALLAWHGRDLSSWRGTGRHAIYRHQPWRWYCSPHARRRSETFSHPWCN